ncbi:hypothetical protein [Nostoc sp. CCY0012]|uniref:hypothetical protein n=1 Tax=Nostoc sp. CCY0012 TaxID=1056123 RepID=UPI0039C638A3
MKLSYDQRTGRFVVSELGRIIDSDVDLDALGIRYGFIAPSTDEITDEEAQEMVEDLMRGE